MATLREIRQRVGYAIARAGNVIEQAAAEVEHLRQVEAELTAHIDTEPEPDPEPPPDTDVEPAIVRTFDHYATTEALRADADGFVPYEDIGIERVHLDNTVAPPGHRQSMRYDYPAGTATDYTISRRVDLRPLGPASDRHEVWVEGVVRWSPDFTVQGNGQGAGIGMKVMHTNELGAAGRFGLDIEGNALAAHGPNDAFDALYIDPERTTVAELFDGRWHTLRHHVRLGSPALHEFWADGTYQGAASGETAASEVWAVALCKNLNMLSGHAMSMWWGSVRVWTDDPVW